MCKTYYWITWWKENDDSSLKDIFITESYKGEDIGTKLEEEDIKDGKKIEDDFIKKIDLISLSKTNKISLKFIIYKLYKLSIYLNKIIKEEPKINIFKPELYNEISGKNKNFHNYLYLYNAIKNNLDNLLSDDSDDLKKKIKELTEIKSNNCKEEISTNLETLTEMIKLILTNFNDGISNIKKELDDILTNNKSTINTVLEKLQSKIDNVNSDNEIKNDEDFQEEIEKMKSIIRIESKGGKSNKKELRQKLNTMSIKQLKRLSDKNNIEYGNKNTIKSLINNYMKHI